MSLNKKYLNYPNDTFYQKSSQPSFQKMQHIKSQSKLKLTNNKITNKNDFTPQISQKASQKTLQLKWDPHYGDDCEETQQLYQQNQKLGYRINYLNDENNFYRISINNVEKLNNKIKKDLDANHGYGEVRNKNEHKDPMGRDKKQGDFANSASVGSSFKLISNKIHIKNLQMKVGNSIRQRQKLKKLYQGSLSSLSKKALQLEQQINKLAREAEYYLIESQLLSNIYKADFYMNFHSHWVQVYEQMKSHNNNEIDFVQNKNDKEHDYDYQSNRISEEPESEPFIEEYPCFQGQQMLNMRPQAKYKRANFERPSELQSEISYKQSNKRVQIEDPSKQRMTYPKGKLSELNNVSYPAAVRFLSCSYKCSQFGDSKKKGWYSILDPKSKGKYLERPELALEKNSFLEKPIKTSEVKDAFGPQSSKQMFQNPPSFMSEQELFLLPQSLVRFVLNSLQKQQIQQNNKLQSLRKEDKEQKKTNLTLRQNIQQLNRKKNDLKKLIDEEFSRFLTRNAQRLDIISQNWNNAFRRIKNNLNKQPANRTNVKSRTLHLAKNKPQNTQTNKEKIANEYDQKQQTKSSKNNQPTTKNLKTTQNNLSTNNLNRMKNTQHKVWNSIQQRKRQADELLVCNLYERQLMEEIQRQQTLLEEQFKINQEYKQKIMDRNEQENKEIKVLEEEVKKCSEQLNQLRAKYKSIVKMKSELEESVGQ